MRRSGNGRRVGPGSGGRRAGELGYRSVLNVERVDQACEVKAVCAPSGGVERGLEAEVEGVLGAVEESLMTVGGRQDADGEIGVLVHLADPFALSFPIARIRGVLDNADGSASTQR